MSWNGSDARENRRSSNIKPEAKSSSIVKIVLPILTIVAGLFILIFCRQEATVDNKSSTVSNKTIEIADIGFSHPTNRMSESSFKHIEETPYWLVDESQTNGYTREMLHKWRDAHRAPPGFKSTRNSKKSAWHIFDHKSENLIASLLCRKPGSASIGRIKHTGLNEDFIESCKVPIVIAANDDAFTKELKREMINTKIALKERIDAGEDLGKIIEETRDEFKKLAEFKRNLNREVRNVISAGDQSSEELNDLISAANKMLEERGIAPLRVTPITREFLSNLKTEDQL